MKIILSVAIALMLAGCATSYQSKGLMGGYSETQIAPDVFRVSFGGNGYTSGERAQDFTLLRAAELTLQHGFRYFVIVDEKNTTKVSISTTPGYAYTSGSFYRGRYVSSSVYSPPTVHASERPQSGLLINCYVEKPALNNVLDADFLQKSLTRKYGMEQNLTIQAKIASKEPQYQAKTEFKADREQRKPYAEVNHSNPGSPTAGMVSATASAPPKLAEISRRAPAVRSPVQEFRATKPETDDNQVIIIDDL
jgi:hypothetical protein